MIPSPFLPQVRHIVADLAKVLPETVHESSSIRELFGVNPLDDRLEPQILICDCVEQMIQSAVYWEDAKKWRTVQDVIDFLEAREAAERA